MQNLIEKLRMKAEPIHQKCLGKGFSEDEQEFVTADRCSHIDPLPVYDDNVEVDDSACRCKIYYKPDAMWKLGRCAMASHYNPFVEKFKGKSRVGQQKQKHKHK